MPLAVRDFSALDAELAQANLLETITRVQEDDPSLDLRRGVLHDLVAYYHAVLGTGQQQNVADYLTGRSVRVLALDPTAADAELVDDLLSNYFVTRRIGSAASGSLAITVRGDTTVTVPAGAVFVARGRNFTTRRPFSAIREAALVQQAGDRLLVSAGNGLFRFLIDVTAVEVGADGRLRRGELAVWTQPSPGYVASAAVEDFQGGEDEESNASLAVRLQEGLAARSWGSRVQMAAYLHAQEDFPAVTRSSIVGFGDPEQRRADRSLFPVYYGGRTDWYIRSSREIDRVPLVKAAVLIAKDGDGAIRQISLGRDDAPGAYEIQGIHAADLDPSAAGLEVTEDIRGFDLSPAASLTPDIVHAEDAVYSRYQTIVVRFRDPNPTTQSIGNTALYSLEAVGLPDLAPLQDLLGRRDFVDPGGDVLVRGPVPAFTQISFRVHRRANDADPDLDGLRRAVADAVNAIGFGERLYGSRLYEIIQGLLPAGMRADRLDMLARIRDIQGVSHYIRDSEALEVPDLAAATGISPRTVQLFASPADVGIEIVADLALEGSL